MTLHYDFIKKLDMDLTPSCMLTLQIKFYIFEIGKSNEEGENL